MGRKAKVTQLPARRAAVASKPVEQPIEQMQLMNERDYGSMMRRLTEAEKNKTSALGTIGQIISEACEKKNGHKGAIGVVRRLDKMGSDKRSAFLMHFDHMRQFTDWDDQKDLFMARLEDSGVEEEIETEEHEEEQESPRAARGNGGRDQPSP